MATDNLLQTAESKITYLYDNHRTWFWILIPILALPFALIFGGRALMAYNESKARQTILTAKEGDIALEKKENDLQGQAAQSDGQAQVLEKQVQDNRASEGDVDWYKKENK